MNETIYTAEAFANRLPLDYAQSLAAGYSRDEINAESAIVSTLQQWSRDRGYEVEPEAAADILRGLIFECEEEVESLDD